MDVTGWGILAIRCEEDLAIASTRSGLDMVVVV
jgi:hypothetical protein